MSKIITINEVLSDFFLNRRIQFEDKNRNIIDGIVKEISLSSLGVCFKINDGFKEFYSYPKHATEPIFILPKYVVLEHIQGPDFGKRFWSTNNAHNTLLKNKSVVYKEIYFTDSEEKAIKMCN